MKLMSPIGVPRQEVRQTAPRLASLSGRRLALLHNGKPGGSELLERIGQRLTDEDGVAEVRYWRKPHPSAGAAFLDELAGSADVAVGALSD